MVGPGGGPPRKSHTKSRNGCKTCKRRHIRCDETFPQCRNCTKHNCRCDYQDTVASQAGSPPAPRQGPDLLMSPEIETQIDNWHRTGVPPYPELLQCPRAGWSGLSRTDLRLIHYIIGASIDLHRRGLSGCTVWAQKMPNFLAIALGSEFVMSSILSFSAFNLAFLTRDPETKQLAFSRRLTALQGLQTALGSFSKENCDAILAASVLLSWQATDHQNWASLQHGISSVLESMHPYWKQESDIAQSIETQRRMSTDLSMPGVYKAPDEDMIHLDQTIQALRMTQKRVSHNPEHFERLGDLIKFTQKFRNDFPNQTTAQVFESVQPIRCWFFWLPASMLGRGESDISALPILAQFFAVGISLDGCFPEMGGAYLGALLVGPIEEIYRIIATHHAADPFNPDLRLPLELMDLPRGIVARHRSRCNLPWSPRSSVDPYSPGPPSPFHHNLHEYSLVASSSSPASASTSYAAYTPPLHSPPAVTIANSTFPVQDGYASATPIPHSLYPPSPHSLYPPSPQLIDSQDPNLGLSDMGHSNAHHPSIPHPAAYTPPYGDGLCASLPRTDGTLGLNMEVYPQPHPFEMPGLAAPTSLWT
ncbi:transcriptional regulator family: Fungal Specific TF [Penicillium roqueforti]|nr:transcriptional regulator family: Fungal Specific TF [Penicillium roqueforti]KAI2752243.1 transcriptional regulator family: Fungal Specific TF [Penicillium roqueforti]KAI3253733.1 transcriptional regulator family: Fungal Specific TF [Penicillium roqueforti]